MVRVGPRDVKRTTVRVTPIASNTLPLSALGTEFGKLMETVMTVPGVMAVVLSDDGGYAIDYVFDEEQIDSLDVQIVGAQMVLPVQRLMKTANKRGLGGAAVILESHQRHLMCAEVAGEYVLAAMLARQSNVALAFRRFEAARARLQKLLVG